MDLCRIRVLLGDDAVDRLQSSRIAIIGLGGVGGICAESLVRSGIGSITICDGDTIDASNVNRQIVATSNNIGASKADEMTQRLVSINPSIDITTVDEYWREDNNILVSQNYDYVIDAIDSMQDKISLIVYCHEHDIPIISAMGAGCRVHSNMYTVADVFDTYNDPMAKKVRYQLKQRGIASHDVVFSHEQPIKAQGVIGSCVFAASACGLLLAEHVVLQITKGK